jgi:hypothetical protein
VVPTAAVDVVRGRGIAEEATSLGGTPSSRVLYRSAKIGRRPAVDGEAPFGLGLDRLMSRPLMVQVWC